MRSLSLGRRVAISAPTLPEAILHTRMTCLLTLRSTNSNSAVFTSLPLDVRSLESSHARSGLFGVGLTADTVRASLRIR